MELTVNGEKQNVPDNTSVAALLQQWGAPEGRIAVVVNDTVVAAEDRPAHILAEGDTVEILTFAAGG